MTEPKPGHHLILGGCGFIGRSVAIRLARMGQAVVIADKARPREPIPADLAHLMRWVPFDLRDAGWDRLLDAAAAIHHFAWSSIPATAATDPAADLAANVLPTLGLLQAMALRGSDAPRLVFASSGGTVYGRLRHTPAHEDHPLRPIAAHGVAKAAAELYIEQFRVAHGLDCRVARLANPYGPGQNASGGQGAATVFTHQALNGEPIVIWGDGEVVRDYIHIDDAAAGLVALAMAPLPLAASVFNIGSGHGVSLNGVLAELEALLGRRLPVRRERARGFDVPVSILDITLAREVLGWSPALSFPDGLARMVASLQGAQPHAYWGEG